MSRFIQFIPSDKSAYLRQNHPSAFLLLSLIAERARRTPDGYDGLQIGDAILGDYQSAGLSRQQYRTALDKLVELRIVKIVYNGKKFLEREKSTIKITIKGMLVNLVDSSIWNINPEYGNQHINQRATNSQPTANHKQERIIKNNKEEEYTTHSPKIVVCEEAPFQFKEKEIPKYQTSYLHPHSYSPKPPASTTIEITKGYGAENNVMLTLTQYQELLNYMKEDERDYWINQIRFEIAKRGEKEFNVKHKSHYHTILSWKQYRSERQKAPEFSTKQTSTGLPSENQKYAKEVAEEFESGYWKIELLSKCIEFCPKSGQAQPKQIAYADNGFRDQVDNELRKKGFKRRRVVNV